MQLQHHWWSFRPQNVTLEKLLLWFSLWGNGWLLYRLWQMVWVSWNFFGHISYRKTLDQFVFGSSTSIFSFFSGNNINPVKKGVIRLVTSVGQRKKIWVPMMNQTSYSIYKHDAIDIADPSSMQDVCHMNFVIDCARLKVSVAQW